MKLSLSLLVVALCGTLAFSATQPFQLSNGMSGSFMPAPGTGMVAAVAIVKTGVRNETAATNGLSHYLEHMLFNGTRTLSQEALYAQFDQWGIYANAQTGKDYTAFMMVGGAEHLDTLLGLLREQLFYSTLPADKFEKEKGIVEREMAKDESDDGYRFRAAFEMIDKANTPYAYPTLGTRASISAMSREAVQSFYQTWYHPNNIELLLAADVSLDEALKKLSNQLEIVPPGDLPQPKSIQRVQRTRDDERSIYGSGKEGTRFIASFQVAPLDSMQSFAALSTAIELFDFQEYAKAKKIDNVGFSLFRDRDFVQMEVEGEYTGELNPSQLRADLLAAITNWSKSGLSASSVRRVKKQREKSATKSAEQLQYWGLLNASNVAIAPTAYWDRFTAVQDRQTPESLTAALKQAVNSPLFLVKQTVLDSTTSAQIPTDLVTKQLANGTTLIVRQSPGSALSGVHLLFKDRSQREPAGKAGIAELAHNLLSEGPFTFKIEQWKDTLAEIGLEWKTADDPSIPYDNYYTSSAFSFVRFDVPVANLSTALSLILQAIQHPRFDSARFDQLKLDAVGRAGRESGTARAMAVQELERQRYGNNRSNSPYGTTSSLSQVSLQDVKQFVSEYWVGKNLILTIDSPIATADVVKQIETSVNQLTSGVTVDIPKRKPSNTLASASLKAGKSQSYLMMCGWLPDSTMSSPEAYSMAGSLLSNDVQMELREKKGWSYSLGASISQDAQGVLVVMSISTKSTLLDSAEQAMREIYKSFLSRPFADTTIQRTIQSTIGRERMREAARQFRAYSLGVGALSERPPQDILPGYRKYQALTEDQIRSVRTRLPKDLVAIRVE